MVQTWNEHDDCLDAYAEVAERKWKCKRRSNAGAFRRTRSHAVQHHDVTTHCITRCSASPKFRRIYAHVHSPELASIKESRCHLMHVDEGPEQPHANERQPDNL